MKTTSCIYPVQNKQHRDSGTDEDHKTQASHFLQQAISWAIMTRKVPMTGEMLLTLMLYPPTTTVASFYGRNMRPLPTKIGGENLIAAVQHEGRWQRGGYSLKG